MSERVKTIVDNRKDLHAHISPAVYSTHARVELLADIDALPFPETAIINPVKLARSHSDALSYSNGQAQEAADNTGLSSISELRHVYHKGFGDRHFTQMFAGVIGQDISRFLLDQGRIEQPLSLADHAKMYQTGWFGSMVNKLSLTQLGVYQPPINSIVTDLAENDGRFLSKVIPCSDEVEGEPYEITVDPPSGKLIVDLTKSALTIVRKRIIRESSVGCPVARTSFHASSVQVEFLEQYGHIGEEAPSGFYNKEIREAGGAIISQGAYTAIDDVLWQWGDYVERYARYLGARGHQDGVLSTPASDVLLLDYA